MFVCFQYKVHLIDVGVEGFLLSHRPGLMELTSGSQNCLKITISWQRVRVSVKETEIFNGLEVA